MRWQDAPAVGEAANTGSSAPRWMAAPVAGQQASAPAQAQPEAPKTEAQVVGDTIVPPPPGAGGYQQTERSLDDRIAGGLRSVRRPLEAFNRAFANIYTIGSLDEAEGGMNALMTGQSYGDAVSARREESRGLREDHPLLSGIGSIAGAVTSPASQAAMKLFPAGAALGRQVVAGAGTGAALGGAQGFMEGEGGVGNRIWNALETGTIGAAMGGIIPGAAELGRNLWRAGDGMLRGNRIGNALARDMGISPDAARLVGSAVGGEDVGVMRNALAAAGPDAMLADASPALARRLDGYIHSPVPGSAVARQRVNERAGNAFYDVMDSLSGGRQGPSLPPVAAQRQMSQQARGGINQAYQRAYNTPIDYSSDSGRAIEGIIDRLPSGTARKAIQRATDRMIYDGAPSPQIMASIDDAGNVTLSQKPNVIQLDYLKRAFDEIAEDGKDAITGRLSSDGAFAARIARDIREATAEAVPEYRNALASAATDIRQRAAVRTGGTLLNPRTTVEQAAEAIADATPAELRAMRQGVRGQIEHIMGNVRAVASDQNIEPRQAMQALRELSSPNAQRKMEALFGSDWPGVRASLDRASAALGLRANTAANSATAARQLADREVRDAVAPGPLRSLQPIGSARQMGQQILGSTPQATSRLGDEVKAELAELFTRQGGAPQQIIQNVTNALLANPANPMAGRGISNALNTFGLSSVPALSREVQNLLLR